MGSERDYLFLGLKNKGDPENVRYLDVKNSLFHVNLKFWIVIEPERDFLIFKNIQAKLYSDYCIGFEAKHNYQPVRASNIHQILHKSFNF